VNLIVRRIVRMVSDQEALARGVARITDPRIILNVLTGAHRRSIVSHRKIARKGLVLRAHALKDGHLNVNIGVQSVRLLKRQVVPEKQVVSKRITRESNDPGFFM
jgi:hypothetical protein